ncbi:MAG: hypothetical protein JNK67_06840 [Alphaproteobacteria bacterium]|nr:hypothetical protein [Alphaproteobacteria bacterium]
MIGDGGRGAGGGLGAPGARLPRLQSRRRCAHAIVPLLLLCAPVASCYGLPERKPPTSARVDMASFAPPAGRATLAIIRPYNFFYFGHPIAVLVDGKEVASLANQTFTALSLPAGLVSIEAVSGTLGPPGRSVQVTLRPDDEAYLVWQVIEGPLGPLGPNVRIQWELVGKAEAASRLIDVEFVAAKTLGHPVVRR